MQAVLLRLPLKKSAHTANTSSDMTWSSSTASASEYQRKHRRGRPNDSKKRKRMRIDIEALTYYPAEESSFGLPASATGGVEEPVIVDEEARRHSVKRRTKQSIIVRKRTKPGARHFSHRLKGLGDRGEINDRNIVSHKVSEEMGAVPTKKRVALTIPLKKRLLHDGPPLPPRHVSMV